MKAQFIDDGYFSRIEIMPDDHRQNSFDGRVEVRFIRYNDEGEQVTEGFVNMNCQLDKISGERAREWGNILLAAASIISGSLYPSLPESVHEAYRAYRLTQPPAPLPAAEDAAPAFVERTLAPDEVMQAGDQTYFKGGKGFEVSGNAGRRVDSLSGFEKGVWKVTRREPVPPEDAAPLVTFQAGEVGYSDNPETPQLDENGDFYY